MSPQNQYFVLHDSEGFEPEDLSNYETVSKFVLERSGQKVPLSERIHVLWYLHFSSSCNLSISLSTSSGSVRKHPQLGAVCGLRQETRSYSNFHISTKVRYNLPSYHSSIDLCDYHSVPIVIVFTQYDRLVRTKELELREEYPQMDPASLRATSLEDAQEAFNICLTSLQRTMNRLKIPMPRYARVSGMFLPLYPPG